jgi:hypothetical protein
MASALGNLNLVLIALPDVQASTVACELGNLLTNKFFNLAIKRVNHKPPALNQPSSPFSKFLYFLFPCFGAFFYRHIRKAYRIGLNRVSLRAKAKIALQALQSKSLFTPKKRLQNWLFADHTRVPFKPQVQ